MKSSFSNKIKQWFQTEFYSECSQYDLRLWAKNQAIILNIWICQLYLLLSAVCGWQATHHVIKTWRFDRLMKVKLITGSWGFWLSIFSTYVSRICLTDYLASLFKVKSFCTLQVRHHHSNGSKSRSNYNPALCLFWFSSSRDKKICLPSCYVLYLQFSHCLPAVRWWAGGV